MKQRTNWLPETARRESRWRAWRLAAFDDQLLTEPAYFTSSLSHAPKQPSLRPPATKVTFLAYLLCKVNCKLKETTVRRNCRYEPLSAQPLVLVLCQVRFSRVRQMARYVPSIQGRFPADRFPDRAGRQGAAGDL